jgi:PAS domain S-box-containing protein
MKPKHFVSNSLARQFKFNYLLVSIIPICFLLITIIAGTKATHNLFEDLISDSIHDLNNDAERSLRELGERIIHAKAVDVAKQIEIYFRMFPEGTMADFRNDPYFMDLAIQKVGQTGYTAITETQTFILRVHPNPNLIDRDMTEFATQLPSWWAIVKQTKEGSPVSGYYDWLEPDGSVRKKFMSIKPVHFPVGGKTVMVAATTYIDEFSIPIVAMHKKSSRIIHNYNRHMSNLWRTFGFIAVLVIIVSFGLIYFIGRRVGFRFIHPIIELSETVRQYGQGQWDIDSHVALAERNDEIGSLAKAFGSMSKELKNLFSRLERQLAELKDTQSALKESEAHYRSLFDGVPVGLYRSAPDGRILDVNTTLVQMLGFPGRESLLSQKAESLYVNPQDRAAWQMEMEAKKDTIIFDTRMKTQDGAVLFIQIKSRPMMNADGSIRYYEGSLTDITTRKKAEDELKKSEARYRRLYNDSRQAEEVYRSLIRSSADAIIIFDLKLMPTYTSPMFTRIFGWTTDDLRNQKIPFVPDTEREESYAKIKSVIKTGIPYQGFESKRTAKDGRLIDVSISTSRYDDHEGNPSGLMVILRDISEKKRFEAQLQHVEKMEAIGTLAGGIAHDFNNLLMAIQGSINLMRYGLEPSDPNYETFINIEKQVERGASLTRQLLGYARKGKYEVRPLDLGEVLMESAETLQRTRKDVTIQLKLSNDLYPVMADVNQIEQVLMNLFINASDAMSEGGELLITASNVPSSQIRHKSYHPKEGDYVLMKIKDTGTGMDQKTLTQIFDPFFTTKEMGRGTGLGLASVYGIVKGHGGYIDVESQLGQGTTFNIYLPASQEAVEKSQAVRPKPTKGTGTILLVDDERLILDVGTNMLEAIGYTVLTADSGQQALEVFEAHKETIDLVILDMIMPETSGGTTFDKIREISADATVLLSSGYSIDGKAEAILKRGCNGFIQKPYSIEKLSKKIQAIIQ